MDESLFKNLVKSLKEAAAITSGELPPAKVVFSKKTQGQIEATESPEKSSNAESLSDRPGKTTKYKVDAKSVREKTGLSQQDFAVVMNVSVATIRNWEQHRREPTGPAEALLKIVSKEPQVALQALHA
ncbi:MAG: helix-turn-helix domain-containing protein [Pseudomonadota bacterium]